MAKAWHIEGLKEGQTLAESAKLIIITKFREAFSLRDEVNVSENIEVIHDMRVSLRRLWAAMTSFTHYFSHNKEFIRLSKRTRKLARKLGAVRDLDVLIELLQKESEQLANNPSALFAIDYIVSHCQADRLQHRAKLFKYLEKLIQKDFERKFSEFFDNNDNIKFIHKAKKEKKIFLNTLKSFYRHDAKGSTKSEPLHELRIAAKKLRYSLEFFEVCFNQSLTEQLKILRQLQELLGNLHDCDVMVDLLKGYRSSINKKQLQELDLGLKELAIYFTNKRASFLELFQNLWQQEFQTNFYNQLEPILLAQII